MKCSSQKLGQRGMASIVITTVFVSVIGLIIMGYSAMARKNQQETLDRQLSTQAYYASESAVEYARAKVLAAVASGGIDSIQSQDQCNTGAYNTTLNNGVAKISCITVTKQVPSLYYESVTASSNTVVPLIPVSGTIRKVKIEWHSAKVTTNSPATYCGDGRPTPEETSVPGITNGNGTPGYFYDYPCEVATLVATFAKHSTGALNVINPVVYLKPDNCGGLSIAACGGDVHPVNPPEAVDFTTGRKQISMHSPLISATNGAYSTVTVNGLGAGEAIYLKLNSLYRNSSVTITALDAANNAILTKGQVVIDSTANTQGVVKRIQARIPVTGLSSSTPVAAIESHGSACKRFVVAPGYVSPGDPYCAP